jgi:hypothetical protein
LAEGLHLSAAQRAALDASLRRSRAAATLMDGEEASTYVGEPAPPRGMLVGRVGELARLQASMEAAEAGVGRLVVLVGEPGVGKTRLAREVRARAARRGWRSVVGRCAEEQATLPYYPVSEALAAAVAVAPSALRGAAERRWPELASLVPSILRGAPPRLEREDARRRLLQAVADFLLALASDAPLLLVLDDLHWADSASLALLQHLARRAPGARLLLLGTYRDVEVGRQHPLEAALSDLWRERLLEELSLRGLSLEDTAALIAARAGPAGVPAEIAVLLYGRTAGNPFFTEELLAALVDAGALAREEACRPPTAVGDIEIPRSVRAVVGRRVSRLAQEAQDLLHAASVLGQECDLDLLVATTGLPEESVLDALDAVLAARLLEERRVGRQVRYAFPHALLQQTIYAELPAHRLRRLHRRAGAALAAARGHRPDAAASLARHFLAAGETAQAIHYAVAAGDHAVGLYAAAEAAAHYQTALDLLLEEDGETAEARRALADVQRKLGGTLHDLNSPEEALESYAAALESYEGLGDVEEQARVHGATAWVHQWRWDATTAAPHLEAALALWPAGREDGDLALLLLQAANARVFSGDVAAAAPLAAGGLDLAERLGEPALQGRALLEAVIVRLTERASPRTVIPVLDRAADLASQGGDWATLARIFDIRGGARGVAGDLQGEAADRRRRVEVVERAGLAEMLGVANVGLAVVCMEQGAWEEARARLRTARADALWGDRSEALRAWLDGHSDRAILAARDGVPAARCQRDVIGVLARLEQAADFALQLGQLGAAIAASRELLETIQVWVWPWWSAAALAYGSLVEALVLSGAAEAQDVLIEAETLLARQEHHVARPQLLRARGLLLRGLGQMDAALAALQASAEVAREQGAVVQLGRTLAVLAETARLGGAPALAAAAAAERAAVVARLGPEARGLPWAGAS